MYVFAVEYSLSLQLYRLPRDSADQSQLYRLPRDSADQITETKMTC